MVEPTSTGHSEDGPREAPSRRPSWRALRLSALLAGAAIVVAITVLPRLGQIVEPNLPTPSPGPTFNLPAALDARVDQAGLMRSGGIWAVQGSYLLTSADNGTTWRAGTVPTPLKSIFVLDRDRAWTVTADAVAGAAAASPTPPDVLFFVDRTKDGGRTWQSAPVAGAFKCDTTTFSLVNADRGYLLCTDSGTVLGTDDGGANWLVAGTAAGLGSKFTASDADTLWSMGDSASGAGGVAVQVSRDAGRTWSTVDLPGLGSVPAGARSSVAAGPMFWDSIDGALAVSISPVGSSVQPAVWFYRTSDAGQSWTMIREPAPEPVNPLELNALVGRQWAVVGTDQRLFGLTVSTDFGASWVDVPGFGMPAHTAFDWVDFADQTHAAATIFASAGSTALMLSSDGGRTWHAADFGGARAQVPADPVRDPVAAGNVAVDFASTAGKDPPNAWNLLSSYSQRAFGNEAAFEATEGALYVRANYVTRVGQPTASPSRLNRLSLGSAVWADLLEFADLNRAYVVDLTFAGIPAPETLVVAPLSVTGDWRIWVVTTP